MESKSKKACGKFGYNIFCSEFQFRYSSQFEFQTLIRRNVPKMEKPATSAGCGFTSFYCCYTYILTHAELYEPPSILIEQVGIPGSDPNRISDSTSTCA